MKKKYICVKEFYQHGHSALISIPPVLALLNPNLPQAPEFQHKGTSDQKTSLGSSLSKSPLPAMCFPQWVWRGSQSHETLFNEMSQWSGNYGEDRKLT